MAKRIAILGSTGSIGRSTLEVVRQLGRDYQIVGLAANRSWQQMAEQVAEFCPQCVAMSDVEAASQLRDQLGATDTEILVGETGCTEIAASDDVDILVAAMVGAAGLPAALEALHRGKVLAIANKEPLVIAGQAISKMAQADGATLLPVDSEHSAIFQAMQAGKRHEVRRVVITASGGPFREKSIEELEGVTPEQALDHPTWQMGDKVTIDSATLMNKALEIIEAKWLFGLNADEIDVVIHPQSIVHSLVEFCDGSTIAQMGVPDMKVPIRYALTYPDRCEADVAPLDLSKVGPLTFDEPDLERFPALRLGFRAAEEGGTLGAVLNAANEVAVNEFLSGNIAFTQIVDVVETTMARHRVVADPSLDEVIAADRWARQEIVECLKL